MVFLLGAYRYFRGNRQTAMESRGESGQQGDGEPVLSGQPTRRRVAPSPRRCAGARQLNATQRSDRARSAHPRRAPVATPDPNEIELESDEEQDFVVDTDVSFPLEVQRGDALADQLRKS